MIPEMENDFRMMVDVKCKVELFDCICSLSFGVEIA